MSTSLAKRVESSSLQGGVIVYDMTFEVGNATITCSLPTLFGRSVPHGHRLGGVPDTPGCKFAFQFRQVGGCDGPRRLWNGREQNAHNSDAVPPPVPNTQSGS